ncbi:MAG TPA: hypothetical protein VKG23_08330 [Thermoanaerobaculia bacterium]|nr:hypothetical protein [Thermoanaerobaculia bacterium]
MRRTAAAIGLLASVAARGVSADPGASPPPAPALGVALNLEASTSPAERQEAVEAVRRTGASFFELTLSWSKAEPSPRQYVLDDLVRTARLLRQSGATLQLDLPLVTEAARDVPADLADVAFDDPKLSLRLGRLLDAIGPALLDFQTMSLGEAADAYFAERPGELRAYRRLFDGAVLFLKKRYPHLLVGVTTLAPTESPAPEVAALLHSRSPLLLYIYCPFVRGKPFEHRPPEDLDRDWERLLKGSEGRPIAFPVVSYSSSEENASSATRQAEFVRRMRRFVSRADGRRLLFARYVALRDGKPEPASGEGAGPSVRDARRIAFLAFRGLETAAGDPKPAWLAWVKSTGNGR